MNRDNDMLEAFRRGDIDLTDLPRRLKRRVPTRGKRTGASRVVNRFRTPFHRRIQELYR